MLSHTRLTTVQIPQKVLQWNTLHKSRRYRHGFLMESVRFSTAHYYRMKTAGYARRIFETLSIRPDPSPPLHTPTLLELLFISIRSTQTFASLSVPLWESCKELQFHAKWTPKHRNLKWSFLAPLATLTTYCSPNRRVNNDCALGFW